MGLSDADVVSLWLERRTNNEPMLMQMRMLRDAYNSDIIIPLPELDRAESVAVANLISTGLDQTAMRIASTMPDLYYPPVKENIKKSEEEAEQRRRATLGWWEANKLPLKMRRRARSLIGYASAPVLLRPDAKRHIARWELRNPLDMYANPGGDPDDHTPTDVIFTYERSRKWLLNNGHEQVNTINSGMGRLSDTDLFYLIEYMDEQETIVLAVLAPRLTNYDDGIFTNTFTGDLPMSSGFTRLSTIPNRINMCPVVVPGRINLDRTRGQFDSLIGMYQMQAKLMALETIAVERAVFPDTYLISRPNENAQFISGPHDGRSGLVNEITGGDIREMNTPPGQSGLMMLDRLERNMRITSGTPAEFGGESQTNVRTGKRGDAILSAVVDFPVQEAQEILASSLQEENKRASAIAKAYFGTERRSFYVSNKVTKSGVGHVDYVPNDIFTTDENVVSYPHPGADANALVVGLGQRVGIGTMSKRTAQMIDPMIDDPEDEHDKVIAESIEQAMLAGLQAQAQQGAIPPADLARIMQLVSTDKADLADAIVQAQQEAQARQATPVPAEAPQAQPGLAQPGQGAEQPTIAPPQQGAQNLMQMLSALRRPGNTPRGERGAPPVPVGGQPGGM